MTVKLRTRDGYFHIDEHYYDQFGKKHRLQKSTHVEDDGSRDNRVLAEQIGERELKEVSCEPPKGKTTNHTVAQAFEMNRIAKVADGCSEDTLTILKNRRPFVEDFFGAGHLVRNIDAMDLVRYVAKRREDIDKKTGKPTAGATIKREVQEFCRGIELCGIRAPKKPKIETRACDRSLDAEEIVALLRALHPERSDIVKAYLLTGLRKAELYEIFPRHINFDLHTVLVPDGKTGQRALPMHPALEALFRRRLEIISENNRSRKNVALFRPWSTGSSNRDLAAACRRAKIDHCNFNDLRRSFSTLLARAGESNMKVAALLGHTTTRMVDQVYARLGLLADHASVARLPAMLTEYVHAEEVEVV